MNAGDELPLPQNIPSELRAAWDEFLSNLAEVAPGVVSFGLARWLNDDDDYSAMSDVCAILIPGFVEDFSASRMREGLRLKRAFARSGISAPPEANPVATVDCVVDSEWTTWTSAIAFWEFGHGWRTVTAWCELGSAWDYYPLLVGFARDTAQPQSIGSLVPVVDNGDTSFDPDWLYWQGMSAWDALTIASVGWHFPSPLEGIDERKTRRWSNARGKAGQLALHRIAAAVEAQD